MGAQSLHHAKGSLGEFFRLIARKLGTPQAITATAHKLARIVYHLLRTNHYFAKSRRAGLFSFASVAQRPALGVLM
jgi:hypothetical protein